MPKKLKKTGKQSGDLFPDSSTLNRLRDHDRKLETEIAHKIGELFQAAKLDLTTLPDGGRARPGDLLFKRTDFGQERRYIIDCVQEINPATVKRAYEDFRYSLDMYKRQDFDEYWLVGARSVGNPMRKRPENDRRFRALDLKELEALLAVPKPKKNKANTRVGKAVLANEKEINLAIDALVLQIDARLEVLNAERPNSADARARVAAEISVFERMKAEVERIRELVASFKKGKAPEQEIVKATKTFRQGVEQWWTNKSDDILNSTAKSAVLVSSIGLLAMMKADSVAAITAVAAVVNGGAITQKAKQIGKAVKRIAKRTFVSGDDGAVQ
ncbi:hypothetical protein [Bradyrhizobium sp. cf659]|uniref:hypothetical protein n=1 Tax=Bradyrhizobium sp. cf659 TaxID=1761771 RepID=UPI0008F078EC|nr:hypothetical protein [Bradyrhizobium sp. cf659]SFJ53905.1 hypothetical protein SAMN04487925_108277 [Bradyrhizobium sp. cf659]